MKEREQSQTPDQVEVESSVEEPPQHPMEEKELAVRTLGLGDLSLSQLGIVETPTTGTVNSPAAKAAEPMEARHRSDSMPVEPHAPPSLLNGETAVDDLALSRPKSITNEAAEDKTPPPSLDHHETKSGLERSGSVRSAIGRRRKRGSSAATGGTGGTIAAAIVAANSSFANPAANPSLGRKFTGFAVANKKRNRDFHNLFKSVPDDDYLIEDYSCAVQREILAHGRLYVSEGHLCFSSNILGWTTTIVISYDEIVSIEKRSTALVFKNGLVISTLHAKHTFASFTSRDSTYDLIVKIWRLGHPSLRSTLNGVSIDEPGGDKTERIDIGAGEPQATQSASGSDEESEGEEDDEDEYIYDEDEDHDERAGAGQSTEAPPAETEADKAVIRKASGAVATNGTPVEPPKEAPAQPGGDDFPGPATHAPTDCGDAETHYDKIVGDDIIPAPLGKVYNLVFGPASVNWMAKFLVNDQKCTDLTMADKKGLSLENKSRTYSYVKPLNSSIGPKSTKCIVTETIEHLDLEKAVNITCATVTPDVPSGNIFSTKTKYCLSWAENNQTRVQMNCTVEWTGKSWLKGKTGTDWRCRRKAP